MAVFDTLAPTYDNDFTRSPIAWHLRSRVHARLARLCASGDPVLELGCGTGEDAVHLARRGIRVLATDSSEGMLEVAREKLAGFPQVQVARLDLRELDLAEPRLSQYAVLGTQPYRLAFANFGVLNCLDIWSPLAEWLSSIILSKGYVAFAVMPPACLWEAAWHSAHGEWDVATRRWRGGGTRFDVGIRLEAKDVHSAHRANIGTASPVFYPSVRRLTQDFAPWFRRIHIEPLGLFLPPSDIYGMLEKRPRVLRTLITLDDVLGVLAPGANFADHYWIEFQRL